jgi:hypothetical protein
MTLVLIVIPVRRRASFVDRQVPAFRLNWLSERGTRAAVAAGA